MAIPDNIKALIEALRTPAAPASTTIQSGPRSGTTVASSNPALGPIEQRRDGYRLYMQDKNANGEKPLSYEEWISQEQ
jgi:hypothetical protein